MSSSDTDIYSVHESVPGKARKRKVNPRKSHLAKVRRLSSHMPGPDCLCSRFKCYENITSDTRVTLLEEFNNFPSKDAQDAYLASLIRITAIKRHRSRKIENEAVSHTSSYQYFVRFKCKESNIVKEMQICYTALLNIHGVTNRRLQTIKEKLKTTGKVGTDRRGKHTNRPHKLKMDDEGAIHEHIQSLKGRHSHYSRSQTKRLYLPEELNISKLYTMFTNMYKNVKVSYDTYRKIFNNCYNFSFGYPRTDTCSTCDEFKIALEHLSGQEAEKSEIEKKKELHLRKAETFYERKRKARLESRRNVLKAAICMDYQKNLPLPNITTNDVYYKRQLSFYSFNIHNLGSRESYFYTYDETIARKGADEVSSMLNEFCFSKLPESVRCLQIFCDSCGGQNKNYTVFRFLYSLVHAEKRFDKIHVIFPVRGHSYLECDKNMGIINQKSCCEVPADWRKEFGQARHKPSPFTVIACDQSVFYDHTRWLKPKFLAKCPFETRPIKELIIELDCPGVFKTRDSYNGAWKTSIAVKKSPKTSQPKIGKMPATSLLLKYKSLLPISKEKYMDLQVLKRFCGQEAQDFFDGLPKSDSANNNHRSDEEDYVEKDS